MNNSLWPLALLCGLLTIFAGRAVGQEGPRSPRRTTSVHWDRVPIGDALTRLASVLDEPIFTDRRVDQNERISLDVSDAASDDVLKQTAAAAALGTSRLGRLAYFGPPTAAGQLRTLAALRSEEIAQLPANVRAALQRKQSLDWPRLTEPRRLVTKLVQGRGWRLLDAVRIPHDLWPAGSLPDLTLAEQLTVLLIGFDLTFAIEPHERVIKLVPITGPVTVSRRYRLPNDLHADQLNEQFPNIEMRVGGEDIVVDGIVEDHERLDQLFHNERAPERLPPTPVRTEKVYTLRVAEQPVGAVLRQLGQRLGWTIEIDDAAIQAAGLSLDERVSFAVQNADEEQLLRALLRPAGLNHRRDGDRVRVFPLGKRGE